MCLSVQSTFGANNSLVLCLIIWIIVYRHGGMVLRVLNVAEKPSAAKEIARILSSGQARSRPGLSQYNHVWDFEYQIQNQNAQMIFTSVSGHLMGVDFTAEYKNWNGCSPDALFTAPVRN